MLRKLTNVTAESAPVVSSERDYPIGRNYSGELDVNDVCEVKRWSQLLQTPKIPGFSPSILYENKSEDDVSNSGSSESSGVVGASHHGVGIRKAISRGKRLAQVDRICTLLLVETTNLYSHFAYALISAGNENQNSNDNLNIPHLTSMNQPIVSQIKDLLLLWAGEVSKFSKEARTTVAKPLKSFLLTYRDVVDGLDGRYKISRMDCYQYRKVALETRRKLVEAIEGTEKIVFECTKSKGSIDYTKEIDILILSEAFSDLKLSQELSDHLKSIEMLEDRHKKHVEMENQCVERCHRLENMALETAQKLEEDRLFLFVSSVRKFLKLKKILVERTALILKPTDSLASNQHNKADNAKGEESKLYNPKSVAPEAAEPRSQSFDFGVESSIGDFFGRLRLNSSSSASGIVNTAKSNLPVIQNSLEGLIDIKSASLDSETGTGKMESEMLGLPEELGELRDQVRACLENRRNQINTAKSLNDFLDAVIVAFKTYGDGLTHQVNKDKGDKDSDISYDASIEVMKSSEEGKCAINLWTGLARVLELEGIEAISFAGWLENFREKKLQHILDYGEKMMKVVTDRDNATWKQLCDVARSQAKAEHNYRNLVNESAKARNRARSVDNHDETASGQNSIQVSQSLVNMFSILPNKGEYAMKLLDSETRNAFFQKTLAEADQKTADERRLLDSAIEFTSLSVDAYKTAASTVLVEYKNDDDKDWANFPLIVDSIADRLSLATDRRQKELAKICQVVSMRDLAGQINDWTATVETEFTKVQELIGSVEHAPEDFALVHLIRVSPVIRQLRLSTWKTASDEKASNNDSDKQHRSSVKNLSAIFAPLKAVDENFTTGWLMRTLSSNDKSEEFQLSANVTTEDEPSCKYNGMDNETAVFCAYFCPEKNEPPVSPIITRSFACSFTDGGKIFPSQYGRIFLSKEKVSFASWRGKHITLNLSDVVGVSRRKSVLSFANDTLVLNCKKDAAESYMMLSGFFDPKTVHDFVENCRRMPQTTDQKAQVSDENTKILMEGATVGVEGSVEQPSMQAQSTEQPSIQAQSTEQPSMQAQSTEQPSMDAKSNVSTSNQHDTVVVPPDKTLQRMTSVLSDVLRGVSIQDFYKIIWSEGLGNNEKPFYKHWLEKEYFDVELGDWVIENVVGEWSKETYSQRRNLKYKLKRKIHLYIGPPIANISQVRDLIIFHIISL